MPRQASILHADLDAFFASVEQRDDPSLRGKPVAVGGGVVLAASYEARAFGVSGAMGGGEARRRCPDLVVVPPRMDAYSAASKAVFEIFRDTTPNVEGLSIDEAFLDVGGLRRLVGPPIDVAVRLRERVRREVGLPITIGIATTKFLAKVASAVGKPDGLLEVPAGGERAFLHPLPVRRLWGVGPVTAEKLGARGIQTVGDLAAVDEGALVAMLGGATGRHLHQLAQCRDPRRVQARARRRSMGAQRALGRVPRSPADRDAALVGLVDRVTRRMRDAERVGRAVTLRVRFGDFSAVTRSLTLSEATWDTEVVLAAVRRLHGATEPLIGERGCTLLGISVSHLSDADAVQLPLPFDARADGTLDAVMDQVRERFGSRAIQRAVLVGRSPGVEMPLLPD